MNTESNEKRGGINFLALLLSFVTAAFAGFSLSLGAVSLISSAILFCSAMLAAFR